MKTKLWTSVYKNRKLESTQLPRNVAAARDV